MVITDKHKRAIEDAAERLLARASNARGLSVDEVAPRVSPSVEKYLLKTGDDVAPSEIGKFVDEIHADDLCLIVACERGYEKAWEELVANFDSTVKSAARKIAANAEDADDLASSIWAELYGLRQDKSGTRKQSSRITLGEEVWTN